VARKTNIFIIIQVGCKTGRRNTTKNDFVYTRLLPIKAQLFGRQILTVSRVHRHVVADLVFLSGR
jgi:hypothetical protein